MSVHKAVNRPDHYSKEVTGLPHEVRVYTNGMYFMQGSAFKYIARSEHKGNMIQDLLKARFCLQEALDNDLATAQRFNWSTVAGHRHPILGSYWSMVLENITVGDLETSLQILVETLAD